MKAVFNVEGMRCQKCVDKIEKFVGEIDGVEYIGVDLEYKKVEVEFATPATQATIKQAILDSGFEVLDLSN
ncbi:MAG: copper ion binding protein [Helicobacter sp.]|nr:copper ion binding protein [Helicobacter sp.]MCI7484391.1 copper ion binding protein [Helicobacter sp.]MDD7567837.1 copper ion binding protein [Helicobacter sp.]MDY5740951.1 copper ion binding protein [Helicobacter sp.]